jgi:hypothetical protein
MFETDAGHFPDDRLCELQRPIGRKYLHARSPNVSLNKIIFNIKDSGVWVNIEIENKILFPQKRNPANGTNVDGILIPEEGVRKLNTISADYGAG